MREQSDKSFRVFNAVYFSWNDLNFEKTNHCSIAFGSSSNDLPVELVLVRELKRTSLKRT